MTELVLRYNYFEFSEKVFRQISRTVTGTNFVPLYACIYRDKHPNK